MSKKGGRKAKLAFFGCVVPLVWTFNERERVETYGESEKRRVKRVFFFFWL